MELSQLKYFLELVSTGNVTRAAEKLYISQPALSKAISNLEEELGIQLFDRSGRSLRVNENGKELVSWAKRIVDTVEACSLTMEDMQKGVHGTLRITSTFMMRPPNPILDYLCRFFLQYPNVRQVLRVVDPRILEQQLVDRQTDIGITLVEHPRTPGIISQELYSEEMGVIVSVHHPLASRKSIRLAELKNERFFCNVSSSDMNDSARYICSLADFEPDIAYEGYDAEFVHWAVSENYGVSLMPTGKFTNITTELSHSYNITYLPIDEEYCYRPVYVWYWGDSPKTLTATRFYNGLKQSIQKDRAMSYLRF